MKKAHTRIMLSMMSLLLISCDAAGERQRTLNLITSSKAGVGYAVCVDKHNAYIANNDGVVIFDVKNPKRPRKVGKIPAGVTFSICVKNGLAYISVNNGLAIADVSNPADPKKLNEYVIGVETRRVQVKGSYAYIASSEGLEILDVDDPGNIIPTAHIGDNGAWGIDVCDGIAYLASPNNGVEVIDVTNPTSPQKITSASDTKGAWDVHIHDELLYVGCHGAGIRIFSISDKKSPELIGSFRDDDGGEELGVWGNSKRLYIADNYSIEVLDVSDPTNPYEIGEYGNLVGAHDIFVDGDYIYVAEAKKGLIIFQEKQKQKRTLP